MDARSLRLLLSLTERKQGSFEVLPSVILADCP